ncbi:MAG: lactate utilization protein [Clostridia bacterium]|nr:lactate utilization protein [Clostridia bacterium]
MEYKHLIEKLEYLGYKACFIENVNEANQIIANAISKDERISFGGSMTVAELKLKDYLDQNGYNLFVENEHISRAEIMKTAMLSDVYILSANAITKKGEIINLDGRGNRIGASAFGPKKVIYVVGINKIVDTLQDGIKRVRNVAAPKNAQRLKMRTPCAVDGKCHDCNSPDRICCAFQINLKALMGKDTYVFIVNENLGY